MRTVVKARKPKLPGPSFSRKNETRFRVFVTIPKSFFNGPMVTFFRLQSVAMIEVTFADLDTHSEKKNPGSSHVDELED